MRKVAATPSSKRSEIIHKNQVKQISRKGRSFQITEHSGASFWISRAIVSNTVS